MAEATRRICYLEGGASGIIGVGPRNWRARERIVYKGEIIYAIL